jgi:hypothetical protein
MNVRGLWLVILSLGILVAVGAPSAMAEARTDCVQSCPDDDADGNCPVGCTSCVCCAHVTPVVPVLVGVTVPPAVAAPSVRHRSDQLPTSADPREIPHVPKPPLA